MYSIRGKFIAVFVAIVVLMFTCATCVTAQQWDDDWYDIGGSAVQPTNTGDIYHMGNVGIGSKTPLEDKLGVHALGLSKTQRILRISGTHTASLGSGETNFGIDAMTIQHNPPSNSPGTFVGAHFRAYTPDVCSVSIGTLGGVDAIGHHAGSGTADTVYGLNAHANSRGGTITNAYGIIAHVQTLPAIGNIANGYGVYIDDNTGNIGNSYGLYQIGSDDINYFAGNVGIGTDSPEAKLEVKDAGAAYVDGPPLGYFGTDATNKIALVGDASSGMSVVLPTGKNIGVFGSAAGGTENWAGYFNGNLYASGNVGIGTTTPQKKLHVAGSVHVDGHLQVDGTKGFVQAHPTDPTKEIVYVSLEGPEAGTYIRGTAQLVDGGAVVNLPEHFSLVTSDEGLTVQLTPVGEWLQLYVVEKDTQRIVVREANGKNGQFDYIVQGVRKGYENHEVIRDNE